MKQTYVRAVKLADLQLHPKNPRRGNIAAIRESIEQTGFYGAVVVQRSTGFILAGNQRYLAAKEAGESTVPAIYLDVDDRTAERVMLVDNRAADLSGYDDSALIALLEELAQEDALPGSGFEQADLDALLVSTGELARRQGAFLDGEADHAHDSWHADGPGNPYFTVAVTVTEEERDVIRQALNEAKQRLDVETAAEAMVGMARHFIARPPAAVKAS
jgi:hypothetical protein